MPTWIQPFLPFLLSFVLLLVIDRLMGRVLYGVAYRLTHSYSFAVYFHALLTWPGTVVHEFSHWIMAQLLRVPVTLPHLLPGKIERDGSIKLGYVRGAETDLIRASLIGVAPFLFGSGLIIVFGIYLFNLSPPDLEHSGFGALGPLLSDLPSILDISYAGLKLYLLFAIANGMMPSPSDRRSWPEFMALVSLVGLWYYAFFGVPETLLAWSYLASSWLTFSFVLTIVLNSALLIILWPLERLLWWFGR